MAKAYRAPLLYQVKITFDAAELPDMWHHVLVKKLPKTLALSKGRNAQFVIKGKLVRDYDIGRAVTLLTRLGVNGSVVSTPKMVYGGVGRRILNWPLEKTDLSPAAAAALVKLGFRTARQLTRKLTAAQVQKIQKGMSRYMLNRVKRWFWVRELGVLQGVFAPKKA